MSVRMRSRLEATVLPLRSLRSLRWVLNAESLRRAGRAAISQRRRRDAQQLHGLSDTTPISPGWWATHALARLSAYSEASRPPIPRQADHRFRGKATGQPSSEWWSAWFGIVLQHELRARCGSSHNRLSSRHRQQRRGGADGREETNDAEDPRDQGALEEKRSEIRSFARWYRSSGTECDGQPMRFTHRISRLSDL